MASFDNSQIKLDVLKKRAYNYRWAEVDEGVIPLTAADPDYPAAPEIREAMIDYINDGCFSYTPKLGYPEFCESISRALKARMIGLCNPHNPFGVLYRPEDLEQHHGSVREI